MGRQILTISQSFGIEGYGFFIALGIFVALIALLYDSKRKQLFDSNNLYNLVSLLIGSGIIGGRLLFTITNQEPSHSWLDFFRIWDGGFSLMGSVIGIFIAIASYSRYRQIPFLPLTDLMSLYGPLVLSIARIGCYWAGCCFGSPSHLPIALIYTDTDSMAPLNIPLHPSQLYHSALLFFIFIFLIIVRSVYPRLKPGIMTCFSIFCIGIERYVVDFYRGDREFMSGFSTYLSVHQIISLVVATGSIILLVSILWNNSRTVNACE